MVDFIRKNHCYQLGDTGKDQVGMQGLLILGTASRKTEILLDVIDLPFNSSPDLIGVIPGSGVSQTPNLYIIWKGCFNMCDKNTKKKRKKISLEMNMFCIEERVCGRRDLKGVCVCFGPEFC